MTFKPKILVFFSLLFTLVFLLASVVPAKSNSGVFNITELSRIVSGDGEGEQRFLPTTQRASAFLPLMEQEILLMCMT